MGRGRSVELLVEEQARRWQLRRRENGEAVRGGIVTLSYLPGAPGEQVAHGVSEALGYDLFDREIIQEIAHNAHLSERVVSALDERDRSWLRDWLGSLSGDAYLSSYAYMHQLQQVVGAIARHGGAVIVGHGAHVILGPGRAFRALVVAPFDARVVAVGAAHQLGHEAARRQMLVEEADRRSFVEKHFHVGFTDPSAFDLVVNTHALGTAGAVDAIATLASKPVQTPAPVAAG